MLALVLAAGASMTSTGAAADPLSDADATVEQLRREADQASQEYFDALSVSQKLEADIAAVEERVPRLVARMERLRVLVEHRAVDAYIGNGGGQLASIISSDDVLTAARRTQWLEQLNARDHEATDRLRKTRTRLETEREQLSGMHDAQAAALEQVQARGRDIDAKLTAALERKRQLEAEAAAAKAKADAEAEAEAEAAAQQPASTPTTAEAGGGAAAAAPPPSYTPTPGVHAMHDDPFLVCTRARESGGNYAAYNSAGPYMGAYQFLQQTWNSAANHAGRLELVGVPPHTASQYDQDDVAWSLYQWRGKGPWNNRC